MDTLQGADAEALESRIRQHYGDGDEGDMEDSGVPGHVSSFELICFETIFKCNKMQKIFFYF